MVFEAYDIIWGQGKVKLPAAFGETRHSRMTGKTEMLILVYMTEVVR